MANSKSGNFSRRDPSRERQWRDRIDQQQRSGESVRAFCQNRKLRETAFYYWRREIALRDREANSKPETKTRQPVTRTLAPVVVVNDDSAHEASNGSSSIEIMLEVITVRVPCNSTREQLDMVLAALEQSRC